MSRLFANELRPDDCLAHLGDKRFMIMLAGEDEAGMRALLAKFGLAFFCHPFPPPAGGNLRIRMSAEDHICGTEAAPA